MTPEQNFEYVFRQYYPVLCRSVNRLLSNPELSEDLVQEVFLKIWERRAKLTFNDRFFFYLKKSCYHAALHFLSTRPTQENIEKTIISDASSTHPL